MQYIKKFDSVMSYQKNLDKLNIKAGLRKICNTGVVEAQKNILQQNKGLEGK